MDYPIYNQYSVNRSLKRGLVTGVLIFTVTFIIHRPLYAQPVNVRLQQSFIWSGANEVKGGYTVFRKVFQTKKQTRALISLFADVRFILWINGKEVLRGPCRFDPKGPQYDQLDITSYLQEGNNAVALLVMEHGSNGKMMDHVPGLTALIRLTENNKQRVISTDETWVWNNHTRYLPARQQWGYTCDRIDARLDDGDWTTAAYDDSHWKKSVSINGTYWGPLLVRQIPLLKEWDMPLHVYGKGTLPLILRPGQSVILELERMIQGYTGFLLEANAGDSLLVEVGYTADSNGLTGKMNTVNSYICRTGKQEYRMSESYGFRYVKVTAVNHPLTLLGAYAKDRRYPYEEVSNFRCNDIFLNQLWDRSLHTLRLNAEDGFMDCALREKAEWMGDGAVVEYPATRVLFGTKQNGTVKSDAGLIKNMILHIAQSLTDSGTVKAHHPSDRWDKHGYIEDYSCLWVHSLREVTELTGDTRLLAEVWPAVKAQLNWFLAHRHPKTGMVLAREFLFMDNPVAYQYGQGATLNALLYQALEDAAFLAQKMKDKELGIKYIQAARLLKKNYNQYLWIPDLRTFSAGLSDNRQLLPTAHAALMAISTGILSAEYSEGTKAFLLANYRNLGQKTRIREAGIFTQAAFDHSVKTNGINMTYTATWLLEFLFRENRSLEALTYIRERWPSTMGDPQTGTLTETFGGGDLCHNFGAVPAYYLATKILGVNTVLPVSKKMVVIHPQPGDLTEADGDVVTEHGVVGIQWERKQGDWMFKIRIPFGCRTQVRFPFKGEKPNLIINGKKLNPGFSDQEVSFELSQGVYTGKLIESKPAKSE